MGGFILIMWAFSSRRDVSRVPAYITGGVAFFAQAGTSGIISQWIRTKAARRTTREEEKAEKKRN